MAFPDTKPLFQSYKDLLAGLRLSGIYQDPHSDAHSILEIALVRTRVEMLRGVGSDEIATLQAVDFDPNPAAGDDDGIRRLVARVVETSLVRYYAMEDMRTFLADGAASARQEYQQGWLLNLTGQDFEVARQNLKRRAETEMEWLHKEGTPESLSMEQAGAVATTGVTSSGIDVVGPGKRVYPFHSIALRGPGMSSYSTYLSLVLGEFNPDTNYDI